jgi:hypothetical protein
MVAVPTSNNESGLGLLLAGKNSTNMLLLAHLSKLQVA